MAKKSRAPMPPKTVQAPRPRTGERKNNVGIPQRKALYGIAGVAVVALIVGVIVVSASGGAKNTAVAKVAPLMKAADCSFKTVTAYLPKGQTMHLTSLTKKFPWNTIPPSNGQHYPLWAVWGFYTEPVNPRQVVHNEEHGGVILWWGSGVSASTVSRLRAFYDEEPDGSFGTPYANFGSKIAITAWTGDVAQYQFNNYYGQGHVAICSQYDAATKNAFEAFREAYRGHGPEGIPLSADEPGMGPG